MKVLILFIFLSCSSSTESMQIVKGVKESLRINQSLIGKTPELAKRNLGTPIIEGVVDGRYRLIYPIKDMKRFYIEITYNTDAELNCVAIDFVKPRKGAKNYVFPRNGRVKRLLRCNQKNGAILKLQEALNK